MSLIRKGYDTSIPADGKLRTDKMLRLKWNSLKIRGNCKSDRYIIGNRIFRRDIGR